MKPGDYVVRVQTPPHYEFTEKDARDNTLDGIDSDVDPHTGKTDVIHLEKGEFVRDVNVGLKQPAGSIEGRVSANAAHSPVGRKGKPQQNGFAEGFNSRLRDECLNEEVFETLNHARRVLALWRYDDNHVRPHLAIGGITPATARRTLELFEASAPGALAHHSKRRYSIRGLS